MGPVVGSEIRGIHPQTTFGLLMLIDLLEKLEEQVGPAKKFVNSLEKLEGLVLKTPKKLVNKLEKLEGRVRIPKKLLALLEKVQGHVRSASTPPPDPRPPDHLAVTALRPSEKLVVLLEMVRGRGRPPKTCFLLSCPTVN